MASGILAKPVLHDVMTNFDPNVSEAEVRRWLDDFRDLPEEIIDVLAKSTSRNDAIVGHYLDNREKYGKTIIFADRWFQCDYFREALRKRGVRADVIYSKIDADPGSADTRNRRTADENKLVLESFRRGDLDVLINVRMLTEGTDVPDVQTVFLTRKTTSQILLTQMIGRALRGPEFHGTSNANIVSFIDNWKHAIPWAEFDQLGEGGASDDSPAGVSRVPVRLVSIELVRRLARQMDTGRNVNDASYLSYLWVGWYAVVFDSTSPGSDEVEVYRKMVGVLEGEEDGFGRFVEALCKGDLCAFQDESLRLDDVRDQISKLSTKHFKGQPCDRVGEPLLDALFAIARHIAQNQSPPTFVPFDARSLHDLDLIAQEHLTASWNVIQIDSALHAEYRRLDRLWHHFYPSYEHFKSHYDGVVNRILDKLRHGESPSEPTSGKRLFENPEQVAPREPDETIKQQVKVRDGYRCLCCGNDRKSELQVDHILSAYHGGLSQLANLQTLCKSCNRLKGSKSINFRTNDSTLSRPPKSILLDGMPAGKDSKDAALWEKFLRRAINFVYECSAVESVDVGRGARLKNWGVRLFAGNDPKFFEPLRKILLDRIQTVRLSARCSEPKSLELTAP
ncbi:MAG: helicase-related protein [Gemmataceae bacterium]